MEGCLAASRADGWMMVISMFLPITLFPKEKRPDESHLKAPFLLFFPKEAEGIDADDARIFLEMVGPRL